MKFIRITRNATAGALLLGAIFLSLSSQPAFGQTSFGSIVGVVTDTSQAVIPGVAITVTNTKTNIARNVTSDSLGNYRVESLLPGIYSVKAEKTGFQVSESTNVEVQVAVTTTINIVMPLGAVTQTVEVVGAAPLLQTAAATVGTVINNNSVVTLPLNGRDFTELISLIPGAVGAGGATYQMSAGSNYSVSGNRAEQNNFTLDGAYDNEEMFKTYGIQPSIDAIQEFKIQTNITSAEYGQAAGANINVATKSGTNGLHGTVFEFLRNNKLDANQWFNNLAGQPLGGYKRNQFGATAGGPLIIPHVYDGRNKTFWFFDYEATRIRQASSTTGYLPTAAQWQGNESDQLPIFNPATTVQNGTTYTRTPFAGNIIPTNLFNPWVMNWAKVFYPMNMSPAAGTNHYALYLNNASFVQNQYQWTGRADQRISDKLSFFARFSLADGTQNSVQALPNLFEPLVNNMRNGVASWTYVANPTTVVDWKVAYNRTNLQSQATNPAPGWPSFLAANPIAGTPIKSAGFPLFPQLQNIGVFTTPYQEQFPFVENQIQIMGNISKIWGKHSVKAGMEFLDFRSLDDGNFTSIFQFQPQTTADPQNTGTTGSAFASFLLGLPSAGLRNLGETQYYARQTRWAPYLQDDIKVTRKLTVNLGLRWEYDQWPKDRWNRVGGFDPITDSYLWAGPNPILGKGPNVRPQIMDPDYNNFAPRVGMAYQLKPSITLRGGYGIFYTSNYMWEAQGERGNWPYAVSQTISGFNTSTTGPLTNNSGSGVNPASSTGLVPITATFTNDVAPGPTSPVSSQHVLYRRNRTPYAQQWNMGVQKMLTSTLMLEVDYVGSRGVKESLFTNLNTALPGPGTVGTAEHPRLYGNQWGAMSMMFNGASSSYHSMQIKVEKRFSNGLQFLNSYTWSHMMDIGGSGFSNSVAPQNPLDWQADKANGIFDRRHNDTLSFYYQLPVGKGLKYMHDANPVVNGILGGWELSSIMHYNTGYPINVGFPSDTANIGPRSGGQRPNWVGGGPRRMLNANDRRLGWLNQANYAAPAQYTFGTAGRNLEFGAGSGYWNPGLLKNFMLYKEQYKLQFRAEFFNALNQHAMGCIDSTYGDTTFGVAGCTQQGSREIQFALKFIY